MMNDGKVIMTNFINAIINRGLLTEFIKIIFNYDYLFDYNYMFRMIDDDNFIIIDIYDNVSQNRFNRYVYDFIDDSYVFLLDYENNILVRKISVINVNRDGDNILKLGYLFKLDRELMLDYADEFMDIKFIKVLEYLIKK